MANAQPISFSVIKIRLDGPFIIVPVRSSCNPGQLQGVTAFVPSDPMTHPDHPRHLFYLDGSEVGSDNGQTFEYTLDPHSKVPRRPTDSYALESFMFPQIHSCFDEFSLKGKCQAPVNYFVKINLPCPDRILLTNGFVPVTYEDGRLGLMPLNHVLEYQVHHPNSGIIIKNHIAGDYIPLSSNADTFVFEVGLRMGSDSNSEHAVYFFNEVALGCFSGVSDMRLASIQPPSSHGRYAANPLGTISAMGTSVECSNGGLIARP
jgi:hypothetical protein